MFLSDHQINSKTNQQFTISSNSAMNNFKHAKIYIENSETIFNFQKSIEKLSWEGNQENQNQDLLLEEVDINKNNDDKYVNLKKIYTCEDIINIFKEKNFPQEIIEKIKEQYITKKDKENVYFFEVKQRRIKNDKIAMKETKSLGRKKNFDNTEGKHNKNCSDNMIKKCKGIFFANVVDYINIYINKNKKNIKEDFKLLKLDYGKYINNLKRDNEIKLFNTKLKDLASFQRSSKYRSNIEEDINKTKINDILKHEKNNEKISMQLNMSFGEWIDIFTFKKNLENEMEFDGLKLVLDKLADSSDEEYLSRLIFFLFNYKRWFFNKKGRRKKIILNCNEKIKTC